MESLDDGCSGARATLTRCKDQVRRQMSWWSTAKNDEWLPSWATCFNILLPSSFHLSSLYSPFPTFPLYPLSFLLFTLLLLHSPFQFLGASPTSYFSFAICFRFEEASWWSPTPGKVTLACMCVSGPTWLARKTAIPPSWRCLVSHRSKNTCVLYERWIPSVQEQFTSQCLNTAQKKEEQSKAVHGKQWLHTMENLLCSTAVFQWLLSLMLLQEIIVSPLDALSFALVTSCLFPLPLILCSALSRAQAPASSLWFKETD